MKQLQLPKAIAIRWSTKPSEHGNGVKTDFNSNDIEVIEKNGSEILSAAIMLEDRMIEAVNGTKSVFMAFTQGNPDEQSFKVYFEYLETLFSFLHYDVKGTFVAAGTRDKNDILQQAGVLEKAREIGKSFC